MPRGKSQVERITSLSRLRLSLNNIAVFSSGFDDRMADDHKARHSVSREYHKVPRVKK